MVESKRRPISDRPCGIICNEPTRTKQSFKAECDINNIMKQYERTGIIDHTNNMHPEYGDFSNVADYHTAQNMVIDAQNSFDALPSHIRKRMGHDPANLIEFLSDPNNKAEAIELGLIIDDTPPPRETTLPDSQDTSTRPEANPPADT